MHFSEIVVFLIFIKTKRRSQLPSYISLQPFQGHRRLWGQTGTLLSLRSLVFSREQWKITETKGDQLKDEASSAAVVLQTINAAIQVWKGTFKVRVTCLAGLVPCRSFLLSLPWFCLCTGKLNPCSESWSCHEVEVNNQFCFLRTRMSVADPGNVGHCVVAKLCASFQGERPQQSQCECAAVFDLLMHTSRKTVATFQGKSRRNIWG